MVDFAALQSTVTNVRYRPGGDGWVADAELAGFSVSSQGRTLAAARSAALESMARKVNDAWRQAAPRPAGFALLTPVQMPAIDQVELPAGTKGPVSKALRARSGARVAAEQAHRAMCAAALALDNAGFSLRDAGEVLELSHARVAQLLDEARAHSREGTT